MKTSEELEHLARRLRTAAGREEYSSRNQAGQCGELVHELPRAELEAAWRAGILELDRAATYELARREASL